MTPNFSEVTSTALPDSSHSNTIGEGFKPENQLFKKPAYYQLLRYFGEIALINLVANH